jgi:hypothetical protein
MTSKIRVSLVDPMLYQSTYVNSTPKSSVQINFWKRFSLLNFILNILLPIFIIVFVLFVLKERYLSKLHNRNKFDL